MRCRLCLCFLLLVRLVFLLLFGGHVYPTALQLLVAHRRATALVLSSIDMSTLVLVGDFAFLSARSLFLYVEDVAFFFALEQVNNRLVAFLIQFQVLQVVDNAVDDRDSDQVDADLHIRAC